MTAGFRRVAERDVHQGHIWRVAVETFEAPDGHRFERDVVHSPGAVGVVPILFDAEGTASVVLLRQYRPVLDVELLEIPAGMRDIEGEDPAATAQRELIEEAGFRAGRLDLLAAFHNSAGMTDAVTHVFLATDLHPAPMARQGPEEEAMTVLQLGLDDAVAQIEMGAITDAKTVIGVLLTHRRLHALPAP